MKNHIDKEKQQSKTPGFCKTPGPAMLFYMSCVMISWGLQNKLTYNYVKINS